MDGEACHADSCVVELHPDIDAVWTSERDSAIEEGKLFLGDQRIPLAAICIDPVPDAPHLMIYTASPQTMVFPSFQDRDRCLYRCRQARSTFLASQPPLHLSVDTTADHYRREADLARLHHLLVAEALLATAKADLAALTVAAAETQTALQRARSQLQAREEELSREQEAAAKARALLQTAEQRAERAEEEARATRRGTKEAEGREKEAKGRVQALEKEAVKLRKRAEHAEKKTEKSDKVLTVSKSVCGELQGHVAALKVELEARDSNVRALESQMQELQDAVTDAEETREALKEAKVQLDSLLAVKLSLSESNEELQAELRLAKETAAKNESVAGEYDKARASQQKAIETLKAVRMDRDRLREEVDHLENQFYEARMELAAAKSRMKSTQEEMEAAALCVPKEKDNSPRVVMDPETPKLRETVDQLKHRLAAEEAKYADLLQSMDSISNVSEDDMPALALQLEEAEAERNALRSRVAGLQKSVSKLMQQEKSFQEMEGTVKAEHNSLVSERDMYKMAFEQQLRCINIGTTASSGSSTETLLRHQNQELQTLSNTLAEGIADRDEQIRLLRQVIALQEDGSG